MCHPNVRQEQQSMGCMELNVLSNFSVNLKLVKVYFKNTYEVYGLLKCCKYWTLGMPSENRTHRF